MPGWAARCRAEGRWLPARPRHLPSRRHHLRRGGQPPRPRPRPARRGCSQRHRSIPTRSLPAHSPTTRPIHDDLAAEITRNRMPVTRAGIDPSASGGTRCSATANSPSDRSAYSARAATAAPVIDLASSNSVFARMLPVSRTAARCHTRAAARHIRVSPTREVPGGQVTRARPARAAGPAAGGDAGAIAGFGEDSGAGARPDAGQGGGQDLTEGAGEEGLLDLEAARAPRRPARHCQQ